MEFYNQKWVGWVFRDYFWAFCFWPFVWYKDEHPSDWQINHEDEHLKQQLKGWLIGYFIRYWFELFSNKINGMTWEQSYRRISYEVEARAAENK
jgi:hypothetical protein